MKTEKPGVFRAWVLASRPKTLAAAAVPVLVGCALAYSDGCFRWPEALLCTLFAFLMQIDANLINDLFDYLKGSDRGDRLGPRRACAEGWIAPRAMKRGILCTTLVACVAGLGLLRYGGPELIAVGAVCVLFAFLYTAGPYPLAYHGWGDLLVVSLEFAPRDEAIEWARKLVAEPRYANTRVILLTHSFIAWKGNRKKTEPYELTDANYQQAIWDKLVYPSSNIRLVICGHECHPTTDYFETVGFRTDKNAAGKSVAQMMFNAQTADGQWHGNGGDCWLRILEFLPDGRTVSVRTFSPMFALSPVTCDKAWRTADYDQFTFDME